MRCFRKFLGLVVVGFVGGVSALQAAGPVRPVEARGIEAVRAKVIEGLPEARRAEAERVFRSEMAKMGDAPTVDGIYRAVDAVYSKIFGNAIQGFGSHIHQTVDAALASLPTTDAENKSEALALLDSVRNGGVDRAKQFCTIRRELSPGAKRELGLEDSAAAAAPPVTPVVETKPAEKKASPYDSISNRPEFASLVSEVDIVYGNPRNLPEAELKAARLEAAETLAKLAIPDGRFAALIAEPLVEVADSLKDDDPLKEKLYKVLKKATNVVNADRDPVHSELVERAKRVLNEGYDPAQVVKNSVTLMESPPQGLAADPGWMASLRSLIAVKDLRVLRQKVLPAIIARQHLEKIAGNQGRLDLLRVAEAEIAKVAMAELESPIPSRRESARNLLGQVRANSLISINELNAEAILMTHAAAEELIPKPAGFPKAKDSLAELQKKGDKVDELNRAQAILHASWLYLQTNLSRTHDTPSEIRAQICEKGGAGRFANVRSYGQNRVLVLGRLGVTADALKADPGAQPQSAVDNRSRAEIARIRAKVMDTGDFGAYRALTMAEGVSLEDFRLFAQRATDRSPLMPPNLRARFEDIVRVEAARVQGMEAMGLSSDSDRSILSLYTQILPSLATPAHPH